MKFLSRLAFPLTSVAVLLSAAGGCSSDDAVSIGGQKIGNGGEPCGSATCGDGEYCCNASCGTCAPVGSGCATLFCTDGGPPACPQVQAPEASACKGGTWIEETDPATGCVSNFRCEIPCGNNVCGKGEYCCNASCGTCAPEGAGCTAIYCEDAGSTCPPIQAPEASACPGGTWTEKVDANTGCVVDFICEIPCGSALCGQGEYCCNASCSACAPAGAGCSTEFCTDGGN